jgi:hypothetical protein
MGRVRRWNTRSNRWIARHPWPFAAIFTVGVFGPYVVWGYLPRTVTTPAAIASFLLIGAANQRKARKAGIIEPPGDRGNDQDLDGPRWRQGLP